MRPGRVLIPLAMISIALAGSRPARAQACQDDESVVTDFKKSITDLVDTVKKETQPQFDRSYHQKSCLTKLTLCLGAVNGLLGCLEKAEQDSTATKEETEACKARHQTYSKLKESVQKDRDTLKATDDSKQAKALIEKFDL